MDAREQTTRPSSLQDLCRRNWRIVSTLLATALACIVLLSLLGHKPLTNWDEGAIYGALYCLASAMTYATAS